MNSLKCIFLYSLGISTLAFKLETVEPPDKDSANHQKKGMSIPLKSHHIDAKYINSIATIEMVQVFQNTLASPVEAIYMMPNDPEVVISKLTIQVGN
jgi:hypothetical protein